VADREPVRFQRELNRCCEGVLRVLKKFVDEVRIVWLQVRQKAFETLLEVVLACRLDVTETHLTQFLEGGALSH
jgi:hypothetical protein